VGLRVKVESAAVEIDGGESDWVSRRPLTLETRMEHGINKAFPEAVSA
jgi:hypothetical protein